MSVIAWTKRDPFVQRCRNIAAKKLRHWRNSGRGKEHLGTSFAMEYMEIYARLNAELRDFP
jgi:hypothetical protein